MTFTELSQICSLLWGSKWQAELSRELNLHRTAVNVWSRQGVPQYIPSRLNQIIHERQQDVLEAKNIFDSCC
jgi:hypothetical protein